MPRASYSAVVVGVAKAKKYPLVGEATAVLGKSASPFLLLKA